MSWIRDDFWIHNDAGSLSLRGNAKAIQNTESKSQKMDCHAEKSARNDKTQIPSTQGDSKICDKELLDSVNPENPSTKREEFLMNFWGCDANLAQDKTMKSIVAQNLRAPQKVAKRQALYQKAKLH